MRAAWEEQKRFPLKVATILSQQFAGHGLQFFKVNKTITHVSVARPHFLDLDATPVSAQVKSIVEFINNTPRCTRRQLVETLAPSPAPATVIPVAPEATPGAPVPAAAHEPTPEQASLIGDLHWLIHQGHVIEFANGVLETAKKPLPKPPPRPPKPEAKAVSAAESVADTTPAPAADVATTAHSDAVVTTETAPEPLVEQAEITQPAMPDSSPAPEPVSEAPREPAAT
jgi:hypothetical protein